MSTKPPRTTRRKQALEVVLKLAQAYPEESAMIEAFEAKLLPQVDGFTGRERGPGECIFYVAGDLSKISEAVTLIAEQTGVGPERVDVRRSALVKTGRRSKAKPFDIFAVPLPNGSNGYVQVLDFEPEFCSDLIRVYALVTPQVAEISEVVRSPELFPPIFTLVSVGLRVNGWIRIGNVPIEFEWPVFRQSPTSFLNPGVYSDWYLWSKRDGFRFVGRLDDSQRRLEFPSTWAPFAVADRIVTGENPAADVK